MTASAFGIGSPINPPQISPWSGAPYGPHAFATFGSQPQQYTPSPLGSPFGVPHQVQYLQYSQLQQNQLLQQIQQVLQILPQQIQQLQQVIQFLPQQIAQVLQQVLIPGSFAAAAPGFTGLAMGQLGSLAGSPVGQTGLPFQTLQPGPNQPGYVM